MDRDVESAAEQEKVSDTFHDGVGFISESRRGRGSFISYANKDLTSAPTYHHSRKNNPRLIREKNSPSSKAMGST